MNKILKAGIIAISLMTLSSCSVTPEDKIVVQRNDVVLLSRPSSVQLNDVIFDSVEIDGVRHYTLTVENYQKLSGNIGMIINYSKDSVSIIEAYEQLIIKSNQK